MNQRSVFSIPLAAMMMWMCAACAPTAETSSGSSAASEIRVATPEEVSQNDLVPMEDIANPLPDVAVVDPQNPEQNDLQASAVRSGTTVDVLLFNGQGISTSDWQSTEKIVKSMGLSYRLINSSELNSMSLTSLRKYGLILVPGGTRGGIMSGLTSAAQLRVRQAVRDYGVSYLGFCAGSFAGVGLLAKTNSTSESDLPVIYGNHLSNWFPPGNSSAVADMVKVKFADGSSRWLVWWGGPRTPEWKGGVIARYSDGRPAISQAWSNKGFVVISGPHPEAPQGWRYTAGSDPDGLDFDLAKKLIRSALTQTPMPAF